MIIVIEDKLCNSIVYMGLQQYDRHLDSTYFWTGAASEIDEITVTGWSSRQRNLKPGSVLESRADLKEPVVSRRFMVWRCGWFFETPKMDEYVRKTLLSRWTPVTSPNNVTILGIYL